MTNHDPGLDFSHRRNVHPAVLLLSELEILVAQTRLVELYLEQAKVNAELETNPIREGYSAESAALRAELTEKNNALQQFRENLQEADGRLQDLQKQLQEQQAALDHREGELHATRSELASLRAQTVQLELSNHEKEAAAQEAEHRRDESQAHLAGVCAKLEKTTLDLQEQRLIARELEDRLRTELQQLTSQLASKEAQADAQEGQLGKAQQELVRLLQQVGELELERNEAFEKSARESDQVRAAFEAQLAGWQATIEQRDRSLEERQLALAEIERAAQTEIRELRDQLADKQQQLQARDNELDGLRATLAETERALAEQEQKHGSRETQLMGELNDLRARLAGKQTQLDGHVAELQKARSEIATLINEKSQLELLQRQTERLLSAQAEQTRQRVRAELADLENRLAEKEEMLQAARQQSAQTENHFPAKISELQLELTEKQLWLQSAHAEIDNLKSHISALSEQAGELESAKRRLETAGIEATDRLRAEHEAELVTLQQRLRQAELDLAEQNAAANRLEESRAAQLLELQEQLALARQEHDAQLGASRRKAEALQERLAQLEAFNRREKDAGAAEAEEIRKTYQGEMATLQSELQQKNWTIAQRQAALENLAQQHKDHVQKLEAKLTEAQRLAENRRCDFERAQTEAASLRDRITQMETAVEQAQTAAAYQLAQLQQQYDDRLAASQAELVQCSLELEERARLLGESESTAKIAVHRLSAEVQEKHALLENRNEELLLVKAEMDLLQERVTELEAEAGRNDQTALSERERMRTEFQAQIALLQAELSQKQWALDERQATVYGVEHNLSAQIQDLQAELAQKEVLLQTHTADFSIPTSELTEAHKERLQMDKIVAEVIDGEASFPASSDRRWRSRLGWKRRWSL